LGDEVLKAIIKLQLSRITKRIRVNHNIPFTYEEDVIQLIAERCSELESGARVVDAILTNTVLPTISQIFLTRLKDGRDIKSLRIEVDKGEFNYVFE